MVVVVVAFVLASARLEPSTSAVVKRECKFRIELEERDDAQAGETIKQVSFLMADVEGAGLGLMCLACECLCVRDSSCCFARAEKQKSRRSHLGGEK